jgi:hypothetical protein
MPPYTYPQVDDFKAQFVSDFPYQANFPLLPPAETVQDYQIAAALVEEQTYISQAFFKSQANFTLGACRLAAHFMVLSLRAQSQGIWGTQTSMQVNKEVGGVSQGFEIPERIRNNPNLSKYLQTLYGWQYLTMILPQLNGVCFPAFNPNAGFPSGWGNGWGGFSGGGNRF